VESLDRKRSRLRKELQDAYGDWLAVSEGTTEASEAAHAVDTAGCPDSRKGLWFAYQAARVRLVEAYAERAGDVPVSREGPHHQDP
jgi:hypothetical protein